MTDISLKPCPFCGGKAELTELEDQGCCIACRNCAASSVVHLSLMEDARPLVAEKWNRRTAHPLAVQRIQDVDGTVYAVEALQIRMGIDPIVMACRDGGSAVNAFACGFFDRKLQMFMPEIFTSYRSEAGRWFAGEVSKWFDRA